MMHLALRSTGICCGTRQYAMRLSLAIRRSSKYEIPPVSNLDYYPNMNSPAPRRWPTEQSF
jgi:hypothetical protein